MNTSNVVLKARVMPEWRKIFEAEDSDFGGGLSAMEVCSSTEMGAPGASHLGTGDHGPKTDRSRPRSVPIDALVLTNPINCRFSATRKRIHRTALALDPTRHPGLDSIPLGIPKRLFRLVPLHGSLTAA